MKRKKIIAKKRQYNEKKRNRGKRAKLCPFIGKCDIKATMQATLFSYDRGIRETVKDKLCERKSILHFCAVCVSASFSLFI